MNSAPNSQQLEQVVVGGNLASLSPDQRVGYYNSVCQSLGLNPLTKPFEYLTLNGKLILYARKDATEQLRKLYGVSIAITSREKTDDVYVVTARASAKDGRSDESIGAVSVAGHTIHRFLLEHASESEILRAVVAIAGPARREP